MNRLPGLLLMLGALQGCALFDAPPPRPEEYPPRAALPAQPPPSAPMPPAVSVPTPYPAPVMAAPAADARPTLQAGPAHAGQPSVLRARPQASSQVEQYIPAGASLRLQLRQINGDGAWWYAEYQGASGWVSEAGLTQ